MTTDTTERGLERLVCTILSGIPCDPPSGPSVNDPPNDHGGAGWSAGNHHDYDRKHCVDLVQLVAFLRSTQPEIANSLALSEDGLMRRKFLTRLRKEIMARGTINVLRNGIKHGAHHISLFYGTPSVGNESAKMLFKQNRFSVTRQLRYSTDETQRALDVGLFINGLPVFTVELKNNLTRQTVRDAIWQYKKDRDPREALFKFGACVAHFAVDENEAHFCTHLTGKNSWFLPFNRGWEDGAGNPPNLDGLKTDYLWREVLTRESLTNIIENYAQIVVEKDERSGNKKRTQIWPRYHQLDVVRRLLADAQQKGVGQRYLIQHSAGSGKSNSIAWLAHQLVGLAGDSNSIFDSVIVVTDRRILDRQICNTIKQYAQVGATVGHADHSKDLREFIESGKKIIISTVQKFPFILDKIGDTQRDRRFAIIIDEAHSSQGGNTSRAMSRALSEEGREVEVETVEDQINREIEARRLLSNASYFAFTATPKHKTLEIFGSPKPQTDGTTKHLPFHSYTMKQAIQEGFIIDVLAHYTPVESYYRLTKTTEADPEFDNKRARQKLRRYVENHTYAVRLKAEIMVDHFQEQVLEHGKLGGKARAMVVTGSVNRAIQYFHAISQYLVERNSQYRAIVAFSDTHEYGGAQVTESSLNKFSSNQITERIREDPYRFLICADKFQTGYDEPLLHTMYVDKILSGIKAVQTLSRLNRAGPGKSDVFVLDFVNSIDTIRESFSDYYRTTILAEETDPNKLHDLKHALDNHQVYTPEQVDNLVKQYLAGAERDRFDPILDACVAVYTQQLDENNQVDFKSKAKAFLRMYGFLSSILPYPNAEWEKLSIFLNFLVLKLPTPVEDDFSKGILEIIDMDSYRVEKQSMEKIRLPDQDAEIQPIPPTGGFGTAELEMEHLSDIIRNFNDQFGNIQWNDKDRVIKLIREDIPNRVRADSAYQNARTNSDEQNARIELDKALGRVMSDFFEDDVELFKQFTDNESFKKWMADTVFKLTFEHTKTNSAHKDSVPLPPAL